MCKRAEISRITFYAHYSDKYALADDIFSDMLQIGTDIYRTKQEKENPGNDLVMGYCNMLNSILEVYYDCFAFFQYTSPQKNPYLASAFYTIVLETIENHTNKIRQNVEVKYSPKKIAGFLCLGCLDLSMRHMVRKHRLKRSKERQISCLGIYCSPECW